MQTEEKIARKEYRKVLEVVGRAACKSESFIIITIKNKNAIDKLKEDGFRVFIDCVDGEKYCVIWNKAVRMPDGFQVIG